MLGKLFGSKKSSKDVQDEMSQLDEKKTPIVVSSDQPTTTNTTLPPTVPAALHHFHNDHFTAIVTNVNAGEKFSDKASTMLPLVEHKVIVHVTYPIVQVLSTMTFRNTNQKTIEGELVLPMPDGATLVGYAMEIDGKLVDAVPIEKEKAKEVFEAEVRAGNTVSIVEKVAQASNCFRTRVYPLPYNKDKTIQVKYQLVLNEKQVDNVVKGTAFVPVCYLDFASLRAESHVQFTLNETSLQGYETEISMGLSKLEEDKTPKQYFDTVWSSANNSKRAGLVNLKKSDLKENMTGFNLTITKKTGSANDILLACENGYFMTSIPVPALTQQLKNQTRIGDKIQVLWDCSLSASHQHNRNLQYLKSILGAVGAKSIELTQFSNDLISTQTFDNAEKVIEQAQKAIYDGGSNMLLLDKKLINDKVDYVVAFTDGVHTFGFEITPMCAFAKPVYFVNTASTVNASLLRHIATKSGGIYLDANELEDDELLDAIGKPVLSFAVADFEDKELEEVYPNEPVSLKEGEVFKLYGKFKKGTKSAKVAVSFRFGSTIYHVQEIELPASDMPDSEAAVVPLLWAQQKIESLSAFPHLFKDEIKKLGYDFRIVTENTSLIVLESLDQYLKHEITPPETLPSVKKQYNELKSKEEKDEKKRESEKIERIVNMWKERVNWHKKDFNIPKPTPKIAVPQSQSISMPIALDGCPPPGCPPSLSCSSMCPPPPMAESACMMMDECCSRSCCLSECCLEADECMKCCEEEEAPQRKEKSKKKSKSSASSGLRRREERECKEEKCDEKPEPSQPSVSGSIKVKAWTPDAAYTAAIANSSDQYKEYLTQRESYMSSPAFYLDVADLFLSAGKKVEGVRVLSNIAELELENVQLYRIVGYRLDQAEELELAEWVFEKVKQIRPDEPQSYRDLALVKERLGKYKESMELFNKVITGKWDMRFDEIEMTAATEMNHLLMNDESLPIVDKRLIHKMDMDVRISMAWDTNDVDIDLHVQEPGEYGEHAYFAHNRTRIGGYVSRDFRQGYGPEEYMLKKAQPGTYKATTNYFASHQQSLTGGTTVLCTFFTNYMRKNEQRQLSTIRLSTNKSDVVVCEIDIAE